MRRVKEKGITKEQSFFLGKDGNGIIRIVLACFPYCRSTFGEVFSTENVSIGRLLLRTVLL